jgi:hypothetical protein
MSLGLVLSDPDVPELHSMDWTQFLGGGTIATSTWAIAPAGPTISGEAVSGAFTSCYVAGAVEGRFYELTNRITPTGGQPAERSITLRGGQR